jgi:hypothetical protein
LTHEPLRSPASVEPVELVLLDVGGPVYDDAYYAAFYTANRTVLERRLNESIAAVAAMIAGAWEAAGKPPLPLDAPSPPQRRRR